MTAKEPVIDFRVLRSRQLATGVTFAAALGLALYGGVFVLPIFLQGLHGFTAWQTGRVILPGAIASAMTMAVVGRNARRIDARYSVVLGASLVMVAMWQLAHLTLGSGTGDLFWPLVFRGIGLGLIFVPLTSASMAELSVRQLAQGTGMFNLTRQLGGSLGIAIMATLLQRYTSFERGVLSDHVVAGALDTQARLDQITAGLVSHGAPAFVAHQQALQILDRQLSTQASMLAFSKLYLLNGFVLLAALPLLLFWKTGRGRGMGPAH
jgi:DHA2 family multidrug resistance protein